MDSIDLRQPLAWTRASELELKMLRNLQGNILKSHGRHFAAHIFVTFGDRSRACELLRELSNSHVIDAHAQLLAARRYRETGISAGDFVHVALSYKAYEHLGLEALWNPPASTVDEKKSVRPFVEGMKRRLETLNDPAVEPDASDKGGWETPFRTDFHLLIIAASWTPAHCARLTSTLTALVRKNDATVAHCQLGAVMRDTDGHPIEHFGFRDGISQPLLLVEDARGATSRNWNPLFPLKAALIRDPGIDGADERAQYAYGSFLVFRKLQQNVRGFHENLVELAEKTATASGTEITPELAGAMTMGRFPDGTPVELYDRPLGAAPNDFAYRKGDDKRCPFHAHIRKTNPRGTGGVDDERDTVIIRRGIPYTDVRHQDHWHPTEFRQILGRGDFDRIKPHMPESDVGLLFIAYQADIDLQFEHMQKIWANSNSFPAVNLPNPHGIDPVIGQLAAGKSQQQNLAVPWGTANYPAVPQVLDHVRMRGGEYFFSPSVAFLRGIAPGS